MTRKLTTFYFFKNTPMTDLVNTIYFKDELERDKYFRDTFEHLQVAQPFNFIRDRSTLRLTGKFKDFKDINYCSFTSEFDDITYYAFIPEYRYINDEVIELNLVIDGVMTFCQGSTLQDLKGINIMREHLDKKSYEKKLPYIKNNSDVIKTHTKKYFYEKVAEFKEFNILIQSTTDLSKEFGDKDNPQISASTGGMVDWISSPVDLYLISESDFNGFMEQLSPYPWIVQNFKRISLIPKGIIDESMEHLRTKEVKNPDVNLLGCKKITGGTTKNYKEFLENIKVSYKELLKLFDLSDEERHLLRNEYTTIELYDWTGQKIIVDSGMLSEDHGLDYEVLSIGGYNNELVTYLKGYKGKGTGQSSFKNDSIMFNSFDEIPILIDSYDLAMSKSANQRKYAESNLLTKRIDRALDKDNDIADRLVSSVSVLSNINPINIGKGLIDEHEYYRQQKAQHLDLALESPIISNQSSNNALNKKHGYYGITLKLSKPDEDELIKVKKYYNLYGFEVEESNTQLSDTRSMDICNYIQFTGSYNIPNCERSLLEVIKLRFENGVRLWHNKDIKNPFIQRVEFNRRVK